MFAIYDTEQVVSTNVQEELMLFDSVEVNVIHPYLEIAKNISLSHEYDINKYNCWNYATDLKRALVEANYTDAKIVMGTVDCSAGFNCIGNYPHAWVEVNDMWIESTNGELIQDRSAYKFGYYGNEKYR